MGTIDIIVSRHEKKDSIADKKKQRAGDNIDKFEVPLSAQGAEDARATGHDVLGKHPYDHLRVVTSEFLRTRQTAENFLEGAGYNLGELRNDARRFVEVTDSRIGLGGANWNLAVPFGNDQEVLNRYVTHALQHHYLECADGDKGTPPFPILAAKGAAILYNVHTGLEDLASRLGPEERGALIVVTHGPIVDTFLEILRGNISITRTGNVDTNGKNISEISLKKNIQAHREGEYATGKALQTPQGTYDLMIDGKKINENQLHTIAESARAHAKFNVQDVHTL